MKTYIKVLFIFTILFSLVGLFGFNISSVNADPIGCDLSTNSSNPCDAEDRALIATFKSLYKTSFRVGSRGSDVRALQQFLKDEGYAIGRPDGKYGKKTAKAVAVFIDDYDVIITATTVNQPISVINPPITNGNLTITTPSVLPNATVGQPYYATINTSGIDPSNSYNWSADNDNRFPKIGFSFGPSYGNSSRITGTPAKIYTDGVEKMVPHTFTFDVTVSSGTQTATKQFTLIVDPAYTVANPSNTYPTISSINTVHGGPAKIGDLINIHGSNFTSSTGIKIDGTYYDAYNNGISILGLSTNIISLIVPLNLAIGFHTIEVYTPSSGKYLLSNMVNLNITAPIPSNPLSF